MSERIDISGPVREICAAFDIAPSDTAQITITPAVATVRVYKRNDEGRHYFDKTIETVADEWIKFKVTT